MTFLRIRSGLALMAFCVAAAAGAEPAVQRSVALALNQAQAAYSAHHYRVALQELQAIERKPRLTDYEAYLVQRSLGTVAAAAGEYSVSADALRKALGSKAGDSAVAGALAQTLIYADYQQHDYHAVINDSQQWHAALQGNGQVRAMLQQAYGATHQCAGLAGLMGRDARDAGALASLVACYQASGDTQGERVALLELLQVQQTPAYWQAALGLVADEPGVGSRYALDMLRLRRRVGLLDSASQYMELAMLELEAQDASGAKRAIAAGYRAGALGQGAGAPRQARLAKLVDQRLAAQPRSWLTIDHAPDSTQLAAGLAMVDAGRIPQGLALLKKAETGVALADAQLQNLRLAEVLGNVGHTRQAHAIAHSVALHTTGALRDLARLWEVALLTSHG